MLDARFGPRSESTFSKCLASHLDLLGNIIWMNQFESGFANYVGRLIAEIFQAATAGKENRPSAIYYQHDIGRGFDKKTQVFLDAVAPAGRFGFDGGIFFTVGPYTFIHSTGVPQVLPRSAETCSPRVCCAKGVPRKCGKRETKGEHKIALAAVEHKSPPLHVPPLR